MKQLLAYVLISLTALGALYGVHELDKGKALAVQEQVFKTRLEASMRLSEQKTRKEEQELAASSVKKEQEKNEQLKNINDKLNTTIVSLSKRPSRSKDSSSAPSVSQACTGRELFKEDGEFLAREAARADQIVVERNYYYEQYESARALLAK